MQEAGASYHTIADKLDSQDVPTKRGGKRYASTVKYIMDNDLYKGGGIISDCGKIVNPGGSSGSFRD